MKGVIMSKPMNPVVCGITGRTLTEWRERTFVQRYINGSLQTIPLYLDVNEVIALHKQSPTYIAKKAGDSAEASAPATEEVAETKDEEVLEEVAPY